MSTPLWDRLAAYRKMNTARFHMPGHKGVLPPPFDTLAPLDVTELPHTGDLYREGPEGAIRQSEALTAKLYHAKDCLYLTNGSTGGVLTMMASAFRPGDTVWVDRFCHQSVYNALALLDLIPVYGLRALLPGWNLPGPLSVPGGLTLPVVYTAPHYYGILCPKPASAGLVLCDAAHGAHLPFCLQSYAPPGNLWVVSAHKTLDALGQTACLFTDGTVSPGLLRERASAFNTASPSFVLLASLDQAQAALHAEPRPDFSRIARFIQDLAASDSRILTEKDLPEGCHMDPLRLVLSVPDARTEAERMTERFGVVPEMADRSTLVFLLSPHNTERDLQRLADAIGAIPDGPVPPPLPACPLPEQKASPREAFWAPRKQVSLENAVGRIAAVSVAPFPPGVPILAPGEKIDKIHVEFLCTMCYNDTMSIWVLA